VPREALYGFPALKSRRPRRPRCHLIFAPQELLPGWNHLPLKNTDSSAMPADIRSFFAPKGGGGGGGASSQDKSKATPAKGGAAVSFGARQPEEGSGIGNWKLG